MALTRRTTILFGAVAVALAGGVAWYVLAGDARESGPAAPAPAAPATTAPPSSPPGPDLPALPPIRTESGVVVGRLFRGAPTNSLAGEVSVEFTGRATASTRTGGRGTFRLEGLPTGVHFALRATAAGCVPLCIRRLRIPDGGTLDVGDLELGAGATLEVLVTQGAVVPAAGAAVSLHRIALERVEGAEAGTLQDDPWANHLQAGVTDEEGRSVLKGVPPGGVFVRVAARGSSTETRWVLFGDGEAPAPLHIHLLPARSLAGTVRRQDGTPVPGVEVFGSRAWYREGADPMCPRATSGADGGYRIDGLPDGENEIVVRTAPGCYRSVATVRIPDVGRFDVTLVPGITLRGRVVEDAGGGPVAGAMVAAFSMGGGFMGGLTRAGAESGPDGTFELRDLPAGRGLEAFVRKAGHLAVGLEGLDGFETLAPGTVLEREVRLHRGGTVRGVVKDAEGNPVAGAVVEYYPVAAGEGFAFAAYLAWVTDRTREDGTYLLSPCLPGKGTLTVRAPGFVGPDGTSGRVHPFAMEAPSAESLQVEVVPGKETTRDFVLAAAGAVEGSVRTGGGKPLAGLSVEVVDPSGRGAGIPGRATDPGGRFRIEGVPPGKGLVVRARGPGLRGESGPFDVDSGGAVPDVAVTVGAPGGIAGVVRSRGGTPLLDPEVHLHDGDLAGDPIPRLWLDRDPDSRRVPDSDGSFRFEGVDPSTYGIVATARGCSPVVLAGIRLEAGGAVGGLDIVLGPGSAVAGAVVDEAGRPVEGAAISVTGSPRCLDTEDEIRRVTGPDGRFEVHNLEAGPVEVIVRHAGRPDLRRLVTAGAMDLVLALEGGRRVGGVVVDAATGKGVPGIEVLVTDPGSEERSLPGVFPEEETHGARTDPEGRFSIGSLAEGAYTVVVGKARDREREGAGADYSPLRVQGVKAGTTDLRLEIVKGLCIAGRLVDAEGNAFRERWRITVTALREKGGRDFESRVRATAAGDGTFRVPGLRPGRYEAEFEAPSSFTLRGMETASPYAKVLVRSVEAGTEDLVVRVLKGLPIAGKVLDEAGKPPRTFGTVRITRTKGQDDSSFDSEMTMTGEDGAFATPALPPGGTYDLKVRGFDGLAPVVVRGIAPGTKDVVIRLARGAAISGRVVLPDGRPAPAGVPVEARETSHGNDFEITTGIDGTFSITGLSGSEFRIVAGGSGSEFAPTAATAVAKPGDSGIEIRIEPGYSVSGTLLDREGRPLRGIRLMTIQRKPLSNYGFVDTASDGSFVVKGLAKGEVEIETRGGNGVGLGTFPVPSGDLRLTLNPK